MASSAEAQLVSFELSYSNPGARSLGFGGAFTAQADDATAAFANPSGLVRLVRPRVRARNDEPVSQAVVRGGDDEIHDALGFGLALNMLQIDLGVDLADSQRRPPSPGSSASRPVEGQEDERGPTCRLRR